MQLSVGKTSFHPPETFSTHDATGRGNTYHQGGFTTTHRRRWMTSSCLRCLGIPRGRSVQLCSVPFLVCCCDVSHDLYCPRSLCLCASGAYVPICPYPAIYNTQSSAGIENCIEGPSVTAIVMVNTHRMAVIFVSLARHQFSLRDHRYRDSTSYGMPTSALPQHCLVLVALTHLGMARLSWFGIDNVGGCI